MIPRVGQFLAQGHNLNKHCRSPQGDATYQISSFKALWFPTRRFVFLWKTHDDVHRKTCALGRAHFWPQGHNLNKLARCLLDDDANQISRLYALWLQTRTFLLKFSSRKPVYSLCDLHVDMQGTQNIWAII